MDDRRVRRAMVIEPDAQGPAPAPTSPTGNATAAAAAEKPFAIRGTIYTAGFLILVLGAVPSLFYILGRWPTSGSELWNAIIGFWSAFRTLVGAAVFTIGLAAYLFCSIWLMYFGRGPHVEFDPPKHFVATGPYRWVRNPVVLTLLVTALGEALYLGSFAVLLFVLAGGVGFAHYQVTRIEEPLLRQRFGSSYEEYCRQVHRWLPKPPRERQA